MTWPDEIYVRRTLSGIRTVSSKDDAQNVYIRADILEDELKLRRSQEVDLLFKIHDLKTKLTAYEKKHEETL